MHYLPTEYRKEGWIKEQPLEFSCNVIIGMKIICTKK